MIEYLEKLWKQFICEHEYEVAYIEEDLNDNKIYHGICIHCGKTKIVK